VKAVSVSSGLDGGEAGRPHPHRTRDRHTQRHPS
jgi:hypothetical protein